MTAREIYLEAARRGLRLEIAGDKLAVSPARLCSPELLATLREHKQELLNLLEGANLTPDCAQWLYIARQVLAGEFTGADRSTIESLCIGLRAVAHPLCRRANERLKG